MSANGMVRPCSCPASERSWEGVPKTRSTPCHRHSTLRSLWSALISARTHFTWWGQDRRGAIVLRTRRSSTLFHASPTCLNSVPSYREAFSASARAVGLWNYIDKDSADYLDAAVADAATADELDGITFHREQIAALIHFWRDEISY